MPDVPLPRHFSGASGDESWKVEIEVDRFADGEPFVVSVYTQHHDDTDDHTTLCTPSPEQARLMAAALCAVADEAERANERIERAAL